MSEKKEGQTSNSKWKCSVAEFRGYVRAKLEGLTEKFDTLNDHVNDEVSSLKSEAKADRERISALEMKGVASQTESTLVKKVLYVVGGGVALGLINLFFTYVLSVI